MIREQSYKTALTAAGVFADKGLTIMAKPTTVLSDLVRLSTPVFNVKIESEQDINNIGIMVEQDTKGTLENPSEHSLESDAYIGDIAKLVTSHVSFAKNKVKPLVMQLADSIINYLQENNVKEPSEKFLIEILDIPELIKDESFLDSITYYSGKTILRPDLAFKLDNKTNDELLSLIAIGHSRTDQLLAAWVSKLPEDFLSKVWGSFFSNSGSANFVTYDEIERINVYEKTNYVLAIYLLARKLFDQVDDSAKEINLSVYKNTAAQIRDYAGSILADCVKKLALYNKTKLLVVSLDSQKYTAKVNGDVYRPWLEAGGSPEVILGLIVSGNQISSQTLIDEKANDFLSQWNSYVSFFKTSESNKAFSYYKDFVANVFNDSLKEQEEIEAEYITKNPNLIANVKKLANQEIELLKPSDMQLGYDVALKLVAKCRFYYTSSYLILNDINSAHNSNPNIDVREAALLAVINYIADYLSAQVTCIHA